MSQYRFWLEPDWWKLPLEGKHGSARDDQKNMKTNFSLENEHETSVIWKKMSQCRSWLEREGWKVATMISCKPKEKKFLCKYLNFLIDHILSRDVLYLIFNYYSIQICLYVNGEITRKGEIIKEKIFWKDETDKCLSPIPIAVQWLLQN